MMIVDALPLALKPWAPHAITGQYRRDFVRRIPTEFMLALEDLEHAAQPEPLIIAEMKSPRLDIEMQEKPLREAMARVIHRLGQAWEIPLEIYAKQIPTYNDPGATILLTIETIFDPSTLTPARVGGAQYYHGIIFRFSASNLVPIHP